MLVTSLAYTMMRLLFVVGKNTDSGDSGPLMFILINAYLNVTTIDEKEKGVRKYESNQLMKHNY